MGEIAVVTGNLHDVALSIEPKTLDHHVAISPGVVDPTCGVAGEVSVVAEDCLRRCELLQLGKQAHAANPNLQRIEHFTQLPIHEPDVSVRERRKPQVTHQIVQGSKAEPAIELRHRVQ